MENKDKIDTENYFVPLNRNIKYWNFSQPLILFDKFFELQIANSHDVNYCVLPSYDCKINKLEIDLFCDKLIYFFYRELNIIHRVNFTQNHWKSLLYPWLNMFIIDIYFKVEEFENLINNFPNKKFNSCIPDGLKIEEFLSGHQSVFEKDDYHLLISSLIAKKFYNFKIKYLPIIDSDDKNCSEKLDFDSSSTEKSKNIFLILKKITIKKIWDKFFQIFFSICSRFKTNSLYLWCTYFDGITTDYFKKKSFFSIKTLSLKHIDEDFLCNTNIRVELKKKLSEEFKYEKLKWKIICLDLLLDLLPFYYLESFSKLLDISKSFLRNHKDLKMIFATCLYCRVEEPFFIAYARSKGVKILTKQHGGNYGFSYNVYNTECNVADILYVWGKWGHFVSDSNCQFIVSPSYRNYLLFKDVIPKNNYILYVGGSLDYHTHIFLTCVKGKKSNFDYIERQMSFFSNLSDSTKNNLLIRNFWLDYGYNINKILDENIPNLNIQNYSQKDYNKNFDPEVRNNSFRDTLINCSLMIYDDIETPFVEALYCNKPFILLLDRNRYIFRSEELEFVNIMESVGIIQYDTVEAANYVNNIASDISLWWNDTKRQEVVKIIRDRYCMKVDNPKKWWYKEFKRQLKLCKHNKVEYE